MILVRSIVLARILVLWVALSALNCSEMAQSSDLAGSFAPQLVIIEEPRVLDDRLADKGITPQSFAETLRFVLSAAPDVAATTGKSNARDGQRELYLSSRIEKFQNSAIWTGEAREPNWGSQILGPVIILDEKGLRLGALSEISALVRAQFTRSLTTGSSVGFSLGCLKSTGQLGPPLQQDMINQLPSRLERVPGIHWQRLGSDVCMEDTRGTYESLFRIEGRIEADEGQVSIEPQISWQALRIPLAAYRGTPTTFGNDRDEYLDVLARGVGAIINQYSQESVLIASDLRASEPSVSADQGLKFLGGNAPYLALPFLQRGATANPGLYYELGTTFQNVSAPRQAENAFRQAIASNSQYGIAHRQLGAILFDQRKYEEASKEFELARDTPGVAEKYAPLLYLLGRREAARDKATSALARGEKSPELQLLLARLDIGEKKTKDAIERLSVNLGDGQDTRMVMLLKEAAAITLQDRDFASAERALSVLIAKAPDPEVYMLSGRVAVAKSTFNKFSDTGKAVDFFTKAIETKGGKNQENPELDLVVLELAEALFFDAQYVQSAARANSFLTAQAAMNQDDSKPDSRATTYRYVPVATLLVLSSQYLTRQTPIDNVIQSLDRRLGNRPPKKPELIVSVPGTNGPTPITISQWSFASFERYACTQLSGKRRDDMIKLTSYLEMKVGIESIYLKRKADAEPTPLKRKVDIEPTQSKKKVDIEPLICRLND